jgi:hypothetical protein
VTAVLTRAWVSPFETRSNFARENAEAIAAAAQSGFVSTYTSDGTFGSTWHITLRGMQHLERT